TIGGDDGNENGNQRGDLDIEAGPGLTIDGDGSMGAGITINANQSDRVLHIESGPVTIEGTTITQGRADFNASERGGGILNQGGNLTLINSSVVNNIADVAGAGIET